MKTVIALIFALNSLAAFAGSQTRFFNKSYKAGTEEELVAQVQASLPSIKDGTDRDMQWRYQHEGCWPNNERYIKVQTLSISKYYKVDQEGILEPYYSGSLSIIHRGCRNER